MDNLTAVIVCSLGLFTAVGAFWMAGILRWAARQSAGEANLPSISIIVVGRNEELLIRSCLESLIRLDYPSNHFEICFVDDHSTDQTLSIALAIAEKTIHLKVLSAPPSPIGIGPKKNALMYGISQTSGEILLFTDADCVVKPGWAKALIQTYNEKTGAVAGATLPPKQSSFFGGLYRLERLLVHYTSASAIGWGSAASVSGTNFSYRRSAFEEIGGVAHAEFPSGDDDLMAQAIQRNGWHIGFAGGAESVAEDLRKPESRRFLQATIRHQSTIRFYPLSWRIAYVLSILSSVLLFGIIVLAILVNPKLFVLIITALWLRAMLDGWGLVTFTRPLGIRISRPEFFLAEFLLPFYTVIRPITTLARRYSWKGRVHLPSDPKGETSS